MPRSRPSSLPSRQAVAAERARRAARHLAEVIAECHDPETPPWPPSADADPMAWAAAHWSPLMFDAFEIEARARYFEIIDTVMGAVALAIHEAGADWQAVRALLARVCLPGWPSRASAEEARLFRRQRWAAWEGIYFEHWWRWAPLGEQERRNAHEQQWQQHLCNEGVGRGRSGSCWWRTMSMPESERPCAEVDITAGLRLARERGHDEAYPRPEAPDEDGE